VGEEKEEDEEEETVDSSELIDNDDVNDTDCDNIDAPPTNFCGTNASTKLLLRLLCVVNIVVVAAMYNKNEMNDTDECDFE